MGDIENSSCDSVVLRRPHFYLKGDELFFMASKRSSRVLSAIELEVWKAIQQPVAMEELREQFQGRGDEVIQEFWQNGLCELVEPAFPTGRRRVLVIEPHADDAALSLGGVMWLRRRECAFIVATMASRSNFTSYYNLERDYFEIGRVMEIRRSESELFVRAIGGNHVDAGMTDAVLRYRDADWTLDFFRRHRVSISVATSRIADNEERKRWTDAVRRLLISTTSDEVWIPLGSPHTDHLLTMNACLAAIVSDPTLVAGRTLRVYQDVPYAARFPEYMGETLAALNHAGVALEPEVIPIGEVFDQKLRLVSIYASQFKLGAMRGDIEDSARTHGSAAAPAELLWIIRRMPDRIDPFGIGPASTTERNQEATIARWASKHKETGRVRVLLFVPTGRWAADLALLCKVLPHARFEVFVSPSASAEVEDVQSDRVEVREVSAGPLAWGFLALRLAVARSAPTLFHVGERRLREAGWASRLWIWSDTLLVTSMNEVIRALERYHPSTTAQLEASTET